MRRRGFAGARGRLIAAAHATAAFWPRPGKAPTRSLSALTSGDPVVIDTSGSASFPPGTPRFVLLTEADELVPLELVFWPGDGTANLYTGSRSLRNYRRPDGSMALDVDVPRIARDGSRYWPDV